MIKRLESEYILSFFSVFLINNLPNKWVISLCFFQLPHYFLGTTHFILKWLTWRTLWHLSDKFHNRLSSNFTITVTCIFVKVFACFSNISFLASVIITSSEFVWYIFLVLRISRFLEYPKSFSPFQLLRVVFLSVTCKSHIEPTGGNFSVVVFSPHKAVYFTTQLFVVSVRDNFTQFPLREIPSQCPLKCKCKPGFSEWKSETENRKTEFTIGFT